MLKTSVPHRNRLGVEFFDPVLGWCGCCSVRCSRGNDFDLYQGFGKGFGVRNESPVYFFACLREGVNGEEVAAGGEAGKESAQSSLVLFNASAKCWAATRDIY